MARVIIPENVYELLVLTQLIIDKEQLLAPNGTLTPAELQQLIDLREAAYKADKLQAQLHRDAEEQTVMRRGHEC